MAYRRASSLTLTTAFLALAAGGLAACDDEDGDERVFYCTNEAGVVVSEDHCDEDGDGRGGSYYLFHTAPGGPAYAPGQQVGNGSRFPYNDQAARSAYNLPATGRIPNGTVKTNVVGKGGGAPAKGSGGG